MKTFTLRVRRSSPREGLPSRLAHYEIPLAEKMTVLDAVASAQRREAPDLAYRYACRVGMCGTCAMVINGREGWACRTLIEELGTPEVTVEPLRNLPVVKDLVVDMTPFVQAMGRAMAHFVPSPAEASEGSPRPDGSDWSDIGGVLGQRPWIDPHIQCITCAACYSACTMLSWDPQYLGPAALNRAATLVRDLRGSEREARLRAVDGDHGCWRCHSQFTCTEVCPMQLRPTEAIGYLKRQLVVEGMKSLVGPRGGRGGEGRSEPRVPRRFLGRSVTWAALASLLVGGASWAYGTAAVLEPRRDFFVGASAGPEVLAGALIFEEQGCEGCHSVLGQGGQSGRDLWRAGERHAQPQLRQVLLDPSVPARGSMPSYAHLTDRDLAAVVAYVAGLDFARVTPARVARPVARGGGELYRSGCLDCHDDRAPGSAPSLVDVVARRGVEGLSAYLDDPTSHQDAVPQVPTLSATRREDVAAYLAGG